MPEVLERPTDAVETDQIGRGLEDVANSVGKVAGAAGETAATELGAIPPPSGEQAAPGAVAVRVATTVPELQHGPADASTTHEPLTGPAHIVESTIEQAAAQSTPVPVAAETPAPNRAERRAMGDINRSKLQNLWVTGRDAANQAFDADAAARQQRENLRNTRAVLESAAADLPPAPAGAGQEPPVHEIPAATTAGELAAAVQQVAEPAPQATEPAVHEIPATHTTEVLGRSYNQPPSIEAPAPERPETESPTARRLLKFIRSFKREFVDNLGQTRTVQRFDAKPVRTTGPDGNEKTTSIAIYRLNPDGQRIKHANPDGTEVDMPLKMADFRTGLTVFQSDLLDRLMQGEDVAFPEESVSRLTDPQREIPTESPEARRRLDEVAEQLTQLQTATSRELAQRQTEQEASELKQTVNQAVAAGDSQGAAAILKDGRAAMNGAGIQERTGHLKTEQAEVKAANLAALTALSAEAQLPDQAATLAAQSAEKTVPLIEQGAKRVKQAFAALGRLSDWLGSGRQPAASTLANAPEHALKEAA